MTVAPASVTLTSQCMQHNKESSLYCSASKAFICPDCAVSRPGPFSTLEERRASVAAELSTLVAATGDILPDIAAQLFILQRNKKLVDRAETETRAAIARFIEEVCVCVCVFRFWSNSSIADSHQVFAYICSYLYAFFCAGMSVH
jgi:hypothetical protein